MSRYSRTIPAALGLATVLALPAPEARACGCFAPPDPSVPILQAGERIVFSHKDGKTIAHIQIQYVGEAQDFGWLLPLPSIPVMRLGVEELFNQIITQTQPKYRLNRVIGDACTFSVLGRGGAAPTADQAGGGAVEEDKALVYQASIGPYEYAVLHADDRQEMFDWLTNNHYFIPTGTEDVVGPYIHPGAYFLALKLRKGESSGAIQPVVVEYESELPMVPIILTSVAANPDMGIQVWVLGEHRAIPRNYRHTVLNVEHLDWFNGAANYNDVVIKAIDEAKGHHSFITEYAGTTEVMRNLLDAPGRFNDRASLERATDAIGFVTLLLQQGFVLDGTLVGLLSQPFPMPAQLAAEGVTPAQFYGAISYYLTTDRQNRPQVYAGLDYTRFDPAALSATIWERIVGPTHDAAQLFLDSPKMTRLYTTLSPEEMTEDPVFSYNPDLPDVSNVHEASLTYHCSLFQDGPNNTPATLALPDGREFYLQNQAAWTDRGNVSTPYSLRIELLRESGPPEIEVDNSDRVSQGDSGGCGCHSTASDPLGAGGMAMVVLALLLRARRRR